jgi:hypothetical protein
MDSEAPETLPVVRCPGCEEPMQPKGSARVTRELDDIRYVGGRLGRKTRAHRNAHLWPAKDFGSTQVRLSLSARKYRDPVDLLEHPENPSPKREAQVE